MLRPSANAYEGEIPLLAFVKKLTRSLFWIVVFLAPLALLSAPLPLRDAAINSGMRTKLVLALLLLPVIFLIGRKVSNLYSERKLLLASLTLMLGLSCYITIVYFGLATPRPSFGYIAVLTSVLLAALCSRNRVPASGLLSLFAVVLILVNVELTLGCISNKTLLPQIAKTPPLAKVDQVNIVYRQNGFRGRKVCKDCAGDKIRMITMGGSSTYGIPLTASNKTYTARFEQLLQERRSSEAFEVLNGGIAGFGIVQVLAALEEELLQYNPDIVSVCSWFNDSSGTPGWYGVPGLSDREAYNRMRLLRTLQGLPVYRQLHNTRLFASFRFYLLEFQKYLAKRSSENQTKVKQPRPKKRLRMNPAEFEWGMEEFVRLSKEYDFLPVLVLEPLNRTRPLKASMKKNKYYQIMTKISKKYDVPLVNTVSNFAKHGDEWLFYDFIHPNAEGHKLIAESIYQELFRPDIGPRLQKFWEAKGVDYAKPLAVRNVRFQVEKPTAGSTAVRARLRAPFLGSQAATLDVLMDNEIVQSFNNLSQKFQSFEIPMSTNLPLADLTFRARLTDPNRHTGLSKIKTPVHIRAISGGRDYGWRSFISVEGTRYDLDTRGYNVVVVGAHSGQVLTTQAFDTFASKSESLRLTTFISTLSNFEEQGQGPIVIVAVKTDGARNAQTLSESLQTLGGSGNIPSEFHSFLLIGSPDSPPNSALEKMGPMTIDVELGNAQWNELTLLESELIETL